MQTSTSVGGQTGAIALQPAITQWAVTPAPAMQAIGAMDTPAQVQYSLSIWKFCTTVAIKMVDCYFNNQSSSTARHDDILAAASFVCFS